MCSNCLLSCYCCCCCLSQLFSILIEVFAHSVEFNSFELHPKFNVPLRWLNCIIQAMAPFLKVVIEQFIISNGTYKNLIRLFMIMGCNRIQCHCSLSIINIHQIIAARWFIHSVHGEMHKHNALLIHSLSRCLSNARTLTPPLTGFHLCVHSIIWMHLI